MALIDTFHLIIWDIRARHIDFPGRRARHTSEIPKFRMCWSRISGYAPVAPLYCGSVPCPDFPRGMRLHSAFPWATVRFHVLAAVVNALIDTDPPVLPTMPSVWVPNSPVLGLRGARGLRGMEPFLCDDRRQDGLERASVNRTVIGKRDDLKAVCRASDLPGIGRCAGICFHEPYCAD